MLAMMRLFPPRSRQLLLMSCLLGHKAPTSRLLLINPSCWNSTIATAGTHKTELEGSPKSVQKVPKRAGNAKSGVGVWSDEQICKLKDMVDGHTVEPEYSEASQCMTKRTTDWTTIGRLLAVDPEECKAMWKRIQNKGKKTGHFTAEEDALIVQRVAEWGNKGPGLWTSLGREMVRDLGSVFTRHRHLILHSRSPASANWTPVMDARLREAVALFKEKYGWVRVAEHMGSGISVQQCKNRWCSYLGRAQQEGIKRGVWSDEEVSQLEELVPQYVIKPCWCKRRKVMTRERVDWTAIAEKLNRIPLDCKNTWLKHQHSMLKKGPYTAGEDALIRQRVVEWENEGKPKGLWVRLQKEMGRSGCSISVHWTIVLAARNVDWVPKESYEEQTFTPLLERTEPKCKWSLDMDARLKEGVAKHKEKEGWMGVAKYMGGTVTARQCNTRWGLYVSKFQKEGVKRAQWSEREVVELQQLVPHHVIKSHWNEVMGVMTKECVDWAAIADKLNRIPQHCSSKWRYLTAKKLKKGPFTAEEDALILKRVAEWGNKGKGLWVSLEKEMGRPASTISQHWKQYMKMQRSKQEQYK